MVDVMDPIDPSKRKPTEVKKTMDMTTFVIEKRDGDIKVRTCARGDQQRPYFGEEDSSSPTVSTAATVIASVIEIVEKLDLSIAEPKEENADGEEDTAEEGKANKAKDFTVIANLVTLCREFVSQCHVAAPLLFGAA